VQNLKCKNLEQRPKIIASLMDHILSHEPAYTKIQLRRVPVDIFGAVAQYAWSRNYTLKAGRDHDYRTLYSLNSMEDRFQFNSVSEPLPPDNMSVIFLDSEAASLGSDDWKKLPEHVLPPMGRLGKYIHFELTKIDAVSNSERALGEVSIKWRPNHLGKKWMKKHLRRLAERAPEEISRLVGVVPPPVKRSRRTQPPGFEPATPVAFDGGAGMR